MNDRRSDTPRNTDDDVIRFDRPDDMTNEDWARKRETFRDFIQELVDEALREEEPPRRATRHQKLDDLPDGGFVAFCDEVVLRNVSSA